MNNKAFTPAEIYSEYGAFLTVTDLTKIMKISRFVVDRLLKTGQIPAAKLGNRYRVRTDDFLKWWDNQVKQEQKNILKNLVSYPRIKAPVSEITRTRVLSCYRV